MYPLIKAIASAFRLHMHDYCNVEGPDLYNAPGRHDKVIVTKDGGLMSVIRLDGVYSYMGDSGFLDSLVGILGDLKGSLSKPGFRLEFYFSRDPENAHLAVQPSIKAMRRSAREQGLSELEEIAKERAGVLAAATYLEQAYLVVRTTTAVLTPGQSKEAFRQRMKDASELGLSIKPGELGQSPLVAIDALRDAHNAMTSLVLRKLGHYATAEELSFKQAIKAMAFCLSPNAKSPDWQPRVLGESFPARELRESQMDTDISHLVAPDIGVQLFDRVPDTAERRGIVRYGDTYHAPLSIDLPPDTPSPLNKLIDNIDDSIPFSVKLVIDTGTRLAKRKVSGKKGWASFMALFNSDNRLISEGATDLIHHAEQGHPLAMVQIMARTWARDMKTAAQRKELLMQALQSWGSMEPIEELGDEIQAWLDNVPGLTNKHLGNRYPMLLKDALMMAPLARPCSPWRHGTQLYRTTARTVFPFLPRSAKQTTNNDLCFAPPGMGKSFMLSAQNMSAILVPGQKRLPRIGILDIGFSSASFVELIRDALPDSRKHEAVSVTYRMTSDYAVNPFDTPLGCRAALSHQRSFLANLITLVMTPASSSQAVPRLDELVGALVDEMYDYFSDARSPKFYQPGECDEVDSVLQNLHYHPDDETPWWTVVDKLFDQGYIREAVMAQRFAVPTLADATEVLSASNAIRSNFGASLGGADDKDLVQFSNAMLASAMQEYPILGQPTAFDFGNARIVSLDLQDVADTGSRQADKKTAIMYMLGRYMLAADFYENENMAGEFPARYQAYHRKRIAEGADDIKILALDEFHRTSHAPAVRAQVIRDMREGRKYGVTIRLLSQMVDDFDADMVGLATNIYILSRGSEDDARKINDLFQPGQEIMDASRSVLRGPGPDGSTMLYVAKLKGERTAQMSQLLYMPIGPKEMWGYTTTPEDVKLRRMLAGEIGLGRALASLARQYPGGSAKRDIEHRTTEQNVDKQRAYELIIGDILRKD